MLVLVLWGTVLLTVILGGLILAMRTEIRLALTQSTQVKAHALAEAGIYHVILTLLQADPRQRPSLTLRMKRYRFGSGQVSTYVEDEAGKIDLNQADADLLNDLLVSLNVGDERRERMVDAILDFRDSDDLGRLEGSEQAMYTDLGLDYGPKNAPFEVVEELLQIPEVSTRLFERLRRALTVHSGRKEVNLLLSPMAVVKAVPNQDAEPLRALLLEERNKPGTQRGSLELEPRYAGTGGGRVFSIRAQGLVADVRSSIAAIVSLDRSVRRPYTVLAWTSG